MRRFAPLLLCVAMLFGASKPATAAPVRLLMTSMSPAGSLDSQLFNKWAHRVDDQSNHTLDIEVKDGYTLASFRNVYDQVLNDVVQVGWAIHGAVGGKFPLTQVASLPFIVKTSRVGSVALWRLYKSGLLNSEYRDVRPLAFTVFPQSQFHFSKRPPSIATLGGVKLSSSGRIGLSLIKLLGGTPISIPSHDVYEALQRGTIQGVLMAWSAFHEYKLAEVTSFHIETQLGASTSMIFMSKKRFDALPKAARDAITENSGAKLSREMGRFFDHQQNVQRRLVARLPGQKIIVPNATQAARWTKEIAPEFAEWDSSRPNAKKVLATYRKLVKEVRGGEGRPK